MRPSAWMLLVLSALPLTAIAGQEQVRVQPGVRVRVTAPQLPGGREVGTVAAVRNDTVVLGVTSVALQSITRFEVSTGRRSHWLSGMAIGFLGGAGIGAIVGASADCTGDVFTPAACALILADVGGAIGIPVGAIVGATVRTDRWQEVPLDQLRVGAMRLPDRRFALTLSLPF